MALDNTTVRLKKLGSGMFWARLSPHYQLLNLSKSGLSFVTDFPVKPGEKLYLKIYFPDGTCLPLKSLVKWKEVNPGSSKYIVGVQFLPFGNYHDYNDLNSLEYLRKLLPSTNTNNIQSSDDFSLS